MSHLVFVRHGESNATVERFIGGWRSCTGLSELGVQQAARLATRLGETGELAVTRLVSSQYPRAQQTAAALAPVLGVTVEENPGFGEHDPGPEVDGMKYAEYAERFPDRRPWDDNPYMSGFVGGESVAQFQLRVGEALHSLTEGLAEDDVALVVCHGGVIDSVFRQLMALPLTGVFELWTLNTSITEFASTATQHRWRLCRYNDSAHLAGLPDATS